MKKGYALISNEEVADIEDVKLYRYKQSICNLISNSSLEVLKEHFNIEILEEGIDGLEGQKKEFLNLINRKLVVSTFK